MRRKIPQSWDVTKPVDCEYVTFSSCFWVLHGHCFWTDLGSLSLSAWCQEVRRGEWAVWDKKQECCESTFTAIHWTCQGPDQSCSLSINVFALKKQATNTLIPFSEVKYVNCFHMFSNWDWKVNICMNSERLCLEKKGVSPMPILIMEFTHLIIFCLTMSNSQY